MAGRKEKKGKKDSNRPYSLAVLGLIKELSKRANNWLSLDLTPAMEIGTSGTMPIQVKSQSTPH